MRLIPEWRHSWRFSSNWFHASQVAVIAAWASVPSDLRSTVPTWAMIALSGTTAYVAAGTVTQLRTASNFTIEALIKPTVTNVIQAIVGHGYLGPLLRLNASGHLNLLKSY